MLAGPLFLHLLLGALAEQQTVLLMVIGLRCFLVVAGCTCLEAVLLKETVAAKEGFRKNWGATLRCGMNAHSCITVDAFAWGSVNCLPFASLNLQLPAAKEANVTVMPSGILPNAASVKSCFSLYFLLTANFMPFTSR